MLASMPGAPAMRRAYSRNAGIRNSAGENFISFDALWMKTSPMSAVSKPFASPAAIIAPELTPTYSSSSVSWKPSNASSIACRHPTS